VSISMARYGAPRGAEVLVCRQEPEDQLDQHHLREGRIGGKFSGTRAAIIRQLLEQCNFVIVREGSNDDSRVVRSVVSGPAQGEQATAGIAGSLIAEYLGVDVSRVLVNHDSSTISELTGLIVSN
jgi:hypothetical protein